MRICVTGGNGMVGTCIKDITKQYPEHEFIFLHRNLGEHSVELTNLNSVLTYFSSQKFDAIIHLAADVGGSPILNKFACIKKAKADGSIKRRIIMDSKKSNVTEASRKSYRAVLPRATDLVTDILSLQATASAPSEIEAFGCDAEVVVLTFNFVLGVNAALEPRYRH